MAVPDRPPKLDWSTDGGQRLAVVAILLVVGGICLLVPILIAQILLEGQKQTAYYDAMQRSIDVRSEVRRLFTTVQNAATSERSFILTGRQEFLDRYQKAAGELSGQLQALHVRDGRLLTTDGAVQRLDQLVPAAMSDLAREIATFQAGGREAAAEMAGRGDGDRDIDGIRTISEEVLSNENSNIERLSEEVRVQAAYSRTMILILFAGIILTVLIAGAAGLVYFAHRRKTERALREAWQAAEAAQQIAEEASRAKSEFLTTMSHEIRTPLHSVIGSAELLLESANLGREQLEYVERIQVSGTALLTLVNDVLDLAKIEAGEVEIHAEPFALEALIDNSVSIVRTTALKKGLKLTVSLDPNLPLMLLGDETRLRQVLLNLLGNAVKFTNSGEVGLRVTSEGAGGGDAKLRFAVDDTGPGIRASRQDRLFKRFSQISVSVKGRSGGTGLGLAISKQLVELMGGEMGFCSEEGRGSTFWFTVSLPQVSADAVIQPEIVPLAGAASGRILVVDDLDQNRDLARRMLETSGYTVDLASDGEQAITAVQANHYDLVLMDIQMARMDGVTATKAIRALDHDMKRIPIIAMTANVLAHDLKAFRSAGMNDHLGKPFKRKQLLDKVRQWLPAGATVQADADHAAAARQPAELPDGETIDELCASMGPDWVRRGLSELREQLDEIRKTLQAEAVDRSAVAQQAHILISRAGLLGFADLARICTRIEQACRNGEPLAPLESRLREVSSHARTVAAELLNKLQNDAATS